MLEPCQHVSRKNSGCPSLTKLVQNRSHVGPLHFLHKPQGKDPTVTEEWPAEVLKNLAALEDIFD